MYIIKMVRKSKRYQRAKSADTGLCGNKAGLPSTVGISLVQRRLFKSIGAGSCCKNGDIDGCRGPKSRKHEDAAATTNSGMTAAFDYLTSVITVTLTTAKDGVLKITDFSFTEPTTTKSGLVFMTGATSTVATFEIKAAGTYATLLLQQAATTVLANTLVPGSDVKISLKADTAKDANGNYFSAITVTNAVTAGTKIKILSANVTYAIVQFNSTVSDAANNVLVATDFTVSAAKADGTAATTTPTIATFSAGASGFIGDQVGGNTYKLIWATVPTTAEVITIKPAIIHKTANGLTQSGDKGGILGQSSPAATTATKISDNPKIVA